MLTSYLNDSLREYERRVREEILPYKPKHSKPYGINRPDTRNILATLVGIFAIIGIAVECLK